MRRHGLWALLIAVTAMNGCAKSGEGAAKTEGPDATKTALATLVCQPSNAMPLEGRASPYDSTTVSVGAGQAKVCYGRPSLHGRTMIGGDAVPYDRLWRTGANEPTTIHLNVTARIAGLDVEPGSYSLYTIPRENADWTLIVNRSTSQWGIESDYTDEVRAQEVGRASVRTEAIETPIEQLTIRPAEGGLALEWQNSRIFIPLDAVG